MSMSQLTGRLHLGQHLAAAVPHRGKTWLLVLAINALMTLGMSVVLVWLSIDRVNTAYFIDVQRSELKDKQSLRAKLEVERDRLLSPYELQLKADQYGMKEPRPGQIRRMQVNP